MNNQKYRSLYAINNYTMGEKIRYLREQQKLSLEKLAKEIGVAKGTLSEIENDNRLGNLSTIIDISNYFDVSIDWLCSRSKISDTDYDLNFVCDYTGLSNEAVNKFSEFKKHNELGDYNSYYGELLDIFVSNGTLFELITLMSEYRNGLDDQIDAMKINTNTYEYRYSLAKQHKLQISQLVEEQDYFSPIKDMNRENIVQLFEIQELPKTFIKEYCKAPKDEYDKICANYETLMERCRILNQQNKEAMPLRDWQIDNKNNKEVGELYGNDQKTQ